MHYNYYLDFQKSVVDPETLGIYVITALIYGWLRWRAGCTTATMIPHAFDNLLVYLSPVIASAFIS